MTELFNPFTGETVEVSKAVSPMYGAKDAFANQPTRKARALLPTGGHVSHANALHVTHHRKRKNVGRFGDTALRRFGKADEEFSKEKFGGLLGRAKMKADVVATKAKTAGKHGDSSNAAVRAVRQKVGKRDVSDLASQPGMINPGVVTSSWSHGTANQNFAASQGRRGRKIA